MSATLCSGSKNHRRDKREAAVLEFLGQYSDPGRVRALLEAQDAAADDRQERELVQVTARLRELETAMLNDLDRLDRKIITEAEFTKRAEVRRQEQGDLQQRKAALGAAVAALKDREAKASAVPVKVRSFIEDVGSMDVSKAKAVLQGLVKAITVHPDGRLEVEFR